MQLSQKFNSEFGVWIRLYDRRHHFIVPSVWPVRKPQVCIELKYLLTLWLMVTREIALTLQAQEFQWLGDKSIIGKTWDLCVNIDTCNLDKNLTGLVTSVLSLYIFLYKEQFVILNI